MKGRILIARRKLSSPFEGGKWEFPGGKVEFQESPEACLVREIKEELDLDIEVASLFDVSSHVYRSGERVLHVVLLCFEARVLNDSHEKMRAIDVEEARWVSVSELGDYEFAGADVPFVEKLRAKRE